MLPTMGNHHFSPPFGEYFFSITKRANLSWLAGAIQGSLHHYFIFLVDPTMQMDGEFEGFPFWGICDGFTQDDISSRSYVLVLRG